MKGIIITAKHHDGFCLWPSAYSEHTIKNSPWRDGKGDLIRELADACEEFGLKFGIYYSPWDRNHADYGKPEYITYMRNQLRELMTNYGDIFEVWFDGANGGTGFYGGANEDRHVDKRSYYDWQNTYNLIRELQPDAVIFGDGGLDIRWVGNEHGFAYETTWSNLMRDSVYGGMPEYADVYSSGQEFGTHWVPAEADVSIRPGWYYHEYEDHKVRTLPELLEIYYQSIGQNSALLINFPVDRRGLIHEKDVEQIMKLSIKIKEDFKTDLAVNTKVKASNERGKGYEGKQVLNPKDGEYWAAEDGVIQTSIALDFDKETTFNRFLIQEYIPLGQRIKEFTLEVEENGNWKEVAKGTTVGFKRILRFDDVKAKQVRLNILDSKASPTISKIGVFRAPPLIIEPSLQRNKAGMVSLIVPEKNVDIFYSIDGSEPDASSLKYEGTFAVDEPLILKAISIHPNTAKRSEAVSFELDIPKQKWKVTHTDEKAERAVDEDQGTFWTSDENILKLDLGEVIHIKGFTYLPPQNRYMSGIIKNYVLQGSLDGITWQDLVSGEFSNIYNNPVRQVVKFDGKVIRFIQLKALSTVDGEKASFAEVGIISGE